jgi:hypothetical protein
MFTAVFLASATFGQCSGGVCSAPTAYSTGYAAPAYTLPAQPYAAPQAYCAASPQTYTYIAPCPTGICAASVGGYSQTYGYGQTYPVTTVYRRRGFFGRLFPR